VSKTAIAFDTSFPEPLSIIRSRAGAVQLPRFLCLVVNSSLLQATVIIDVGFLGAGSPIRSSRVWYRLILLRVFRPEVHRRNLLITLVGLDCR
jgi:hypothetical protein